MSRTIKPFREFYDSLHTGVECVSPDLWYECVCMCFNYALKAKRQSKHFFKELDPRQCRVKIDVPLSGPPVICVPHSHVLTSVLWAVIRDVRSWAFQRPNRTKKQTLVRKFTLFFRWVLWVSWVRRFVFVFVSKILTLINVRIYFCSAEILLTLWWETLRNASSTHDGRCTCSLLPVCFLNALVSALMMDKGFFPNTNGIVCGLYCSVRVWISLFFFCWWLLYLFFQADIWAAWKWVDSSLTALFYTLSFWRAHRTFGQVPFNFNCCLLRIITLEALHCL